MVNLINVWLLYAKCYLENHHVTFSSMYVEGFSSYSALSVRFMM